MPGHLVQQSDVPPKVDNDGVEIRTTIDKACGCQALVQSVVSFPVGRSQGSAMAGHEQSMFVLSGTATLYLDGLGHHELTPDTAAYIASGESYSIENDGPDPLVALVVDAPTRALCQCGALSRVKGEGFLHMAGETRPIRAGSCIYLPPLHMHCLENAGDGPMRVLGVFQPAGSPAARYAEEA